VLINLPLCQKAKIINDIKSSNQTTQAQSIMEYSERPCSKHTISKIPRQKYRKQQQWL